MLTYKLDKSDLQIKYLTLRGEGRLEDRRQEKGNRGRETEKTENGRRETGGRRGGCWPSSDYAESKLDAERRLIALSDEGTLHNLIIVGYNSPQLAAL